MSATSKFKTRYTHVLSRTQRRRTRPDPAQPAPEIEPTKQCSIGIRPIVSRKLRRHAASISPYSASQAHNDRRDAAGSASSAMGLPSARLGFEKR